MAEHKFTFDEVRAAFDYPVAPGYMNACSSGKAAQIAFIKYLQQDGEGFFGGVLQRIVLNLADELHQAQSDEQKTSIQGKIVGAFSGLEPWLRYAAKNASTDDVRNATPESIHQALQDAADGGPAKRWEASLQLEASERGRRAARARWDKRKASTAITAA